jgi:hypothetical protein
MSATAMALLACAGATAPGAGTVVAGPLDTRPRPHVFVMPPLAPGTPAPGNVGRDFAEVERVVAARLLAVVRELDPGATMAETRDETPFLPMQRYIDAIAPARTTRAELNAAGFALQHGGTHLVVPAIVEWREVRTDDPIGALIPPHDGVVVSLRLVRLDPPAAAGYVTFENHARVTLNRPADHLLNGDFRRAVLRLLGGVAG